MAQISFGFFRDERARFQHMMGDSALSLSQVERALEGLGYLYLRLLQNPTLTQKQKDTAETFLYSAVFEHNIRASYRRLAGAIPASHVV